MDLLIGASLSLVGYKIFNIGIELFTNNLNITPFVGGFSENKSDKTYLEYKRLNYSFGKYPPCFNYSNEVQQIYDYLDMNGVLNEYNELLNVYSILLCQKYHASYKTCDSEMLNERINELIKIAGTITDKEKYMKRISKYVKLNNSNVSKLIFYAFYIIENNIKKINEDQIIILNNRFYLNHLSEIQKLCDGF
jgi:hypothetical protein